MYEMYEPCYYSKPRFFRYRDRRSGIDPAPLRTASKPHEQGECQGDARGIVTKMINGSKRHLCLADLGRTDD